MDTFGPVSDNAQGIAEMSGDVDGEGAAILTELDAVGNTTKAITKGIAIATAVLAATALFGSFTDAVATAAQKANATNRRGDARPHRRAQRGRTGEPGRPDHRRRRGVPVLRPGDQRGRPRRPARSCSRCAGSSARSPGSWTAPAPEYGKVVDICTRDSLRELARPACSRSWRRSRSASASASGRSRAYLAGAIATGTLMAVFLANSGGAWDNAKKLVEDGDYGGKGSPAHEATIIGDTVGDPFKDTAGPAINPLIKVMNLVSLLIAPAVVAVASATTPTPALRVAIAVVAAVVVAVAVYVSKRRPVAIGEEAPEPRTVQV